MKRLIEQTACDHGFYEDMCPQYWTKDLSRCGGGSSREVTGEEVGWMTDDWGLPVVGYFDDKSKFEDDNARFLVIPVEAGR